jgi:hypothetical protein
VATLKEAEELGLEEALSDVFEWHRGAELRPELWKSLTDYYGERVAYGRVLDILAAAEQGRGICWWDVSEMGWTGRRSG